MAGLQCNQCGGSHSDLLSASEEREECYQHYRKKHIEDMQGMRSTISDLKEEFDDRIEKWSVNFNLTIAELEEQLGKYGQHLPTCDRRLAYERMGDVPFYHTDCTCGWSKIIKEMK